MNKGTGMHVGGASVLLIFVLLCLTTFSVLSLVSANADYRLSQKAAEASARYYEADAQAETMLARIDAALKVFDTQNKEILDDSSYNARLTDAVSSLKGVVVNAQEDIITLDYQIPIDDVRALQVSVRPQRSPIFAASRRYTLMAWQVVQTAEWEPDDTLSLWDPEDAHFLFDSES